MVEAAYTPLLVLLVVVLGHGEPACRDLRRARRRDSGARRIGFLPHAEREAAGADAVKWSLVSAASA